MTMARILIADDDAHTRRIMTMWLRQNGHDVTEAHDGAEALEVIETGTFDLLISDMNMPRLNGLGLAKAVREKLNLELPILMLSSRCDQAGLQTEVRPFGVRLFPKPFVPSRLVLEIERMLVGSMA
jgi:CheY-like chemotaxis protein